MLDMLNGMQHLMTGSNEFDPIFYQRLVTCLNKVSVSANFKNIYVLGVTFHVWPSILFFCHLVSKSVSQKSCCIFGIEMV